MILLHNTYDKHENKPHLPKWDVLSKRNQKLHYWDNIKMNLKENKGIY